MKNKIVITITLLTSLAVSNNNGNIGGNNSFNNNQGTIQINQSNSISTSVSTKEIEIDNRIHKKLMTLSLPKDNYKQTLLYEFKKINKKKLSINEKKRQCKQKIDSFIKVYGHEVVFSYKKCNEIFH